MLHYFVVMINYRSGQEATVRPDMNRDEVITLIRSGELKNISWIHEIKNGTATDVTDELFMELTA